MSPEEAAEALPPATADAEALRQVYSRGVDEMTSPAGPSAYVQDVVFRLMNRLAEWIEARLGFFEWLRADFLVWGVRVLFLLLGLFLVIALLRWLWRRRPVRETGDGAVEPASASTDEAAPVDHAGELRRCLAAGDVEAALEALWWWLADALERPRADPSWTSRELLVHAGRLDLRGELRRFDRLVYGLASPSVDEVRDLWQRLRSRLRREPSRGVRDAG